MLPRHLKPIFATVLLLLDACALLLAFEWAYQTRFNFHSFVELVPITKGIPELGRYHESLFVLLPVWLFVLFYNDHYTELFPSASDEFVRSLKGLLLCAILTMALTFAYRTMEFSRPVIGIWFVYGLILSYGLRQIAKLTFFYLLYKTAGPHRILAVGKSRFIEAIRNHSRKHPLVSLTFLDHVPTEVELRDHLGRAKVHEVLLLQGGMEPDAVVKLADTCDGAGVECRVVPDMLELRRGEIIMDGFLGLPAFRLKAASLYGSNYILKRTFDVVVSVMILVVLSIPLAVIGVLIWLDSSGPILYSQERTGFRGQPFRFFKFRTMVRNADALMEELKKQSDRSGPVFKMRNDPRITSLGRWLRRYSIDELPQILNVLRGDMSLVGPRPQVLWEAAHYNDEAKKRLRILPGITGLWQVSGRASLSFDEMIHLDLYYLENWSLGLDLKIILKTFPAVFSSDGAY